MGSPEMNKIIFVWQTCFTFSAHFSLQTPFPQSSTKAQGDTNKWKQHVIETCPCLGATQWVGEPGVKRLLGPKMRTCKIAGVQLVSCVAQFIVCILSKMYDALMSEGPKGRLSAPLSMNFWKSSKRPLTPPPHFRKVILRISRQKCVCSYGGTFVYYKILFPMRCM